MATAKAQRWDPTEVIRVLLEAEATGRNKSMLATRRKRAGFPTGKTFDVWDEALSTLPAATTSFLRTLEWVRRSENLIACGPSGRRSCSSSRRLRSRRRNGYVDRQAWLDLWERVKA
ncbi:MULTISPECIES: ATP-binding protein [unclassified Pseudarthrobacter]|uniref:ATP-binding protein n=1 Tax=unclassified Pseudarthrobacter TaxID=2647000 RepID=UPI003076D5C9